MSNAQTGLATAGFIGLGRMGGAMARNLVKAGVAVVAFDVDEDALKALEQAGAKAVANPADVASKCATVFLCLPYTPEVKSVMFGAGGLIEGANAPLRIIDTTTLGYDDALAIAEEAKAHGIGYSDCPISGMPFRAENGTLTMMFGGSDEAFAHARPYLDTMGEFIVHCGALGMGQAMKAINNIIYDVNIAAICEVLPLAVKLGFDPETLASVVTSGTSRSFASEYFIPRMLERRFDTDFSMGAAHKDIENVKSFAQRLDAPMPVVNAMIGTYEKAMKMGFADEPKSAMLKLTEQALGVTFEKASPDAPRHS